MDLATGKIAGIFFIIVKQNVPKTAKCKKMLLYKKMINEYGIQGKKYSKVGIRKRKKPQDFDHKKPWILDLTLPVPRLDKAFILSWPWVLHI